MPEFKFLLCISYKRNVSRLCKLNNNQGMPCFLPHFPTGSSRSELRKVMLEWAKQF